MIESTGRTTTTSSREGDFPLTLSPRLSALRSHFRNHEIIWDIGCDHGKLGLAFLAERAVNTIHLVDPSEHVIRNLKNYIDSYITDPFKKIKIENKKGQEITLGPQKKLILIAGMGGKEINEILERLQTQLGEEDDVIISPHRDILLLRNKLHSSPFSLVKESLVFDENRFYQVLALSVRKGPKVHPYGDDVFQGDLGKSYLLHQKLAFSAHKDLQSRAYLQYLDELTQCF